MDNRKDIEIQWVKEFLIPKLIENGSLKGKPTKDEFSIKEISLKFIDSAEAFMLTNCFKIHLTYNCKNEAFSEDMVVKKTPKVSKEDYDAINFKTLFGNEILAYTKILPELGSPTASLTLWDNYPKYYYSHLKDDEACIVLGDFVVDGWCMSKKQVDLSVEHLLLAAKHIGKFHGICYDLKHNNPEFFKSIIKLLGESRYAKEPPPEWDLILRTAGQRSINSARKYYGNMIPENFLKKLNQDLSNIFEQGKERLRPIEPEAILCHGDYLRNNVAFQYKNTKDKDLPTAAMMFDFQTLRYSSPMCDLTTFISLSSGKDTRQKNFERIFKSYCDSLKDTYESRTSNKIPDYLSYNSMLEEYVRYLPYSLGIASSFLATLYEPHALESTEEFLNQAKNEEQIIKDTTTRGGETVDKELAALVYELYDFSQKLHVDIF
ncbi:uncharacterized protein LOC129609708 [Condylostylus longicornis]|uniref:uncharacterized protein LOC129609708 n=1 Tax=Condylostylus longicornis TaxID=2530218 RepID=UPI00244E275A|nr:uncharacterized protein LOC129609708 [Condylostylus longicornis]